MFEKEDSTYRDIQRRSLEQWLYDMERNDDVSVRGGIPLVRSYLEHLETENARLQSKCELKDRYLKELKKRNS